MIVCPSCSKENQDHYKFCLGCGAKLPPRSTGASAVAPAAAPAPLAPTRTAAGSLVSGGRPSLSAPIARGYTPPPLAPAPAGGPPIPTGKGTSLSASPLGVTSPAASPFSPAAQTPSPAVAPLPAAEPKTPAPRPEPVFAPAPAALSGAQAVAVTPSNDAQTAAGHACPKCSAPIQSSNAFCGRCGFRLRAPSNPGPSPEAKPAAAAAVARTLYIATPPKSVPQGHLTLIRPDGSEGGQHTISEGDNLIGRGQGSLFDADPYLSPRHAEFSLQTSGLVVRDLKSLNGVFVKLAEEEALDSGSIFRIGQELLRFDVIAPPEPLEDGTEVIGTPNPGYWGRISVIVGRDVDGPAFPIFEESIVLGRERGDILFPEDGYVSATHARISVRDGMVYLQDLGSSNGTFIRIEGERVIPSGSLLLMGQQLFRVSFRS
ncbi:MAG: FHA domain-containing protein [Myxococcales bacterium]|nr:FHA domain-containing protein [Myxococcales bacterium]